MSRCPRGCPCAREQVFTTLADLYVYNELVQDSRNSTHAYSKDWVAKGCPTFEVFESKLAGAKVDLDTKLANSQSFGVVWRAIEMYATRLYDGHTSVTVPWSGVVNTLPFSAASILPFDFQMATDGTVKIGYARRFDCASTPHRLAAHIASYVESARAAPPLAAHRLAL